MTFSLIIKDLYTLRKLLLVIYNKYKECLKISYLYLWYYCSPLRAVLWVGSSSHPTAPLAPKALWLSRPDQPAHQSAIILLCNAENAFSGITSSVLMAPKTTPDPLLLRLFAARMKQVALKLSNQAGLAPTNIKIQPMTSTNSECAPSTSNSAALKF